MKRVAYLRVEYDDEVTSLNSMILQMQEGEYVGSESVVTDITKGLNDLREFIKNKSDNKPIQPQHRAVELSVVRGGEEASNRAGETD